MRAARRVEALNDQCERSRHEYRSPDALQHPERHQLLDTAGDGAQPGRNGEHQHTGQECPSTAQQIGQPAGRNHEGGEDDVIAVQNPGQAPDVVGREGTLDIRERDVDDCRVEKRQESAEPRYQQNRRRRRSATTGEISEPLAAVQRNVHARRGAGCAGK